MGKLSFALLVVILSVYPASSATIPGLNSHVLLQYMPFLTSLEHVLKDPSFVQCLNQHAGADPTEYVNVVATCYGFVGRPR